MDADQSKDYIVQIKVRNGPLLRAMRQAGFKSALALARSSGSLYGDVLQFLSLEKAPVDKRTGLWRQSVLRIADTLGCAPEDLFPQQHYRETLRITSGEIDASLEDITPYLSRVEQNPQKLLESAEAMTALTRFLNTLPPKERYVIDRRFGLDGDEPETLREIGEKLDVGPERVRTIESNALRKLMHPSIAKHLRKYTEDT